MGHHIYMKSASVEEAIGLHASNRHGLVTRTAAVQLGLSTRMIEGRLRTGRWSALGRGVYRVVGVPVTWEQKVLAACLLAGDDSVASHSSAAVLWEMSGMKPAWPEVTVPRGVSARRAARLARVHHSGLLEADDVAVHISIPVTSPARTVIDLAGRLSPTALVDVVDGAVCRRLVGIDTLRARIGELSPSRPGLAALRQVLEAWTPGPLPANKVEMRLVRLLLAHGISAPERQHEVRVDGALVARMDLAWPAAMLAVELQSVRWHATPQHYNADRQRILTLKGLGWQVIEVTPRLLDDDGGALLISVVAEALATRQPPAGAA